MGSLDLSSLCLTNTTTPEETVDFTGKALKLDNADSVKPIADAIAACKKMTCLNLEGNTLGVEAAKALGKALESQPHLSRALWKDLFTGRMKNEIPPALSYLSSGLMLAKAQLVELDLSDNAFGPVGIEGVVALLKSPVCFSLQILRLNNNGLGITGGKMLAKTLMEGLEASQSAGQTMQLKVFISGRNRLENEAATALAGFFKAVGTLEEVAMPQNGIYFPGITALAQAFECNKNLRIINLNDNTFTEKGAAAMGAALQTLTKIEVLNFGDCLLKRQGAIHLAEALSHGHENLKELHLGSNEIDIKGALRVTSVLKGKKNLKVLDLNGNQLGEDGCVVVVSSLQGLGLDHALTSLSEDEGEASDEEEGEEEEEEEGEEEGEEEEEEDESAKALGNLRLDISATEVTVEKCTPDEFLEKPSSGKLRFLGPAAGPSFVAAVQSRTADVDERLRLLVETTMKIASTVNAAAAKQDIDAAQLAGNHCMKAAFDLARHNNRVSSFTNSLLVHLGLIKGEDKKFKMNWTVGSAFLILEHVARQRYFDNEIVETLRVFLNKPNLQLTAYASEKQRLLDSLAAA